MMKVLALCLVFTSVATAGFFTPRPEKHNPKDDDVTVREGHAGSVVIGFEKDNNGNTKVSVSPKDDIDERGYVTNTKEKLSGKVEEVTEKIKEATSEATSSLLPDQVRKQGNGKEEPVSDAVGKVKDAGTQTARKASDKTRETKESMKDAAGGLSSKAKDKVDEVKEGAKERAYDTVETTKAAKEEAERKVEGAKEKAKEKAEELVGTASDRVKKGGGEGLKGFFGRAGEVIKYMVLPVRILPSLASVLHLLGFAAAYGMSVWVTFASSYVLAGALPRHQFAMVQSKMYPVYFRAMASSVGMALLGSLISRGKFGGLSLMASLAMILVNMLYLEPRETKVMLERMKKEKEEGSHATEPAAVELMTDTAAAASTGRSRSQEGAKEKQAAAKPPAPRVVRRREVLLHRLNSNYSPLLNVATLVSLTWHLVHLAQNLHAVC